MSIPERYVRNRQAMTEAQQKRLAEASVLVLGCGGIGGYVIEHLARIGVGHIAAVDGDVFQASNLNRQLLCTEENIGMNKALAGKSRVGVINSEVSYEAFPFMVSEENIHSLIRGRDVVIDCLDDPKVKLLCAKTTQREGVPFIHGAISGWCFRVHTMLPGDGIMELLCASGEGMERRMGCLPFTAAACACLQAAEAVKLLLGIGENTANRLIEADLLNMRFDEIFLQ